jgi:glutamate-5-semialdehyde dehydrogenase
VTEIFQAAQRATQKMSSYTEGQIIDLLNALAETIVKNTTDILKANQKDLARMPSTDPKYDRLKLTETRIADIARDIRQVAQLESPLNLTLEKKRLPNGLDLEKITVPLGVIGVIYEARPNVTLDVFSLCFKSGNVCLLKGGSDAENSNQEITALIRKVLSEHNVDADVVQLLPSDRSATQALLQATKYVDVIIPRGSQQLIDYVRENSKVPVIETGAGIVHVYFDESGDVAKGSDIVFNSKTRRVSVCNALDCLIIHKNRLEHLSQLTGRLAEKSVTIYADEEAFQTLKSKYPASLLEKAQPQHFGTEFLDYKMSIKTVSDFEEALDHIAQYSSRHSEAIVAESHEVIEKFLRSVDAAAVYANASTAFTDGAQFGLGAEIGISTQKLHARGPMALKEMTSYKWMVRGNGQIRTP